MPSKMNLQAILNQLLQSSKESEVVEYKEAKNSYDFTKLGKYFSALCNEANLKGLNHAWLVFGVKNDHTIVGTQYRLNEVDLHSLKEEIANKTNNRLTFREIHTCEIEVEDEYKRVILFEIPPAPQGIPVAWDGHWYGRDHEALGPLNIEELERIRNQNKLNDWSAEICLGATIDDLEPEAIVKARELYALKNPKHKENMPDWDDATFLNKAKLTIQGKVTRTAILLLGKEESTHFLNPATPTITWILKDKDGLEKDYEHFSSPVLLAVSKVFQKIRNLKYRYLTEGNLFPEEVDQYDPYLIREALNNAIAHQDYELGGKVSIVEFEDGRLCFSNPGSFIPGNIFKVIQSDSPESRYRNRFLAEAMVNLDLIDTIGSGIRKMFFIQKNRFFPLPQYDLSNNQVQVQFTGRVLDMNYATKLATTPDLSLSDIFLLDKLQKGIIITEEEAKSLKKQKLIEGRKPNYIISAGLAQKSGHESQYIRNKAFDDQHYKDLILKYLKEFGEVKRIQLDELLFKMLPEILSDEQKGNKIKNLLQSLKKEGKIEVQGKVWKMSKSDL